MAYTLKTTGIATKLRSCIGVDEDGVTVKDFVTGNVAVHHASIATPKTGAATWKGVTRNWFRTDSGAGLPNTQGITWTTPPTGFIGTTGLSFWCAANTMPALADQPLWACEDENDTGFKFDATGKAQARASAILLGTSTTAIPTAAKVSFGVQMKQSGTGLQFFRGLESAALAADGTYNDPGALGNHTLFNFGGRVGYGSVPGEYFLACWFVDAALITEAEMQSLHNDWFGTLFESTTTPFSGTGIATVLSARAVVASGAFGLVYRITGTMVDPSTGAPRANLTGIDAAFFDESNPSGLTTPRQTITNLTTDGSGNFTWSLPNSTLVAGQTGLFVAHHAALGYLGAYRVTLVA